MALRARITENPWDAEAWSELAQEVSSGDPDSPGTLDEQRAFYEELLTRFPTAVRISSARTLFKQYRHSH